MGDPSKYNLYYNQELLNSINDTGIEIIIIKSKTINEARRILNKLILILPRLINKNNAGSFCQFYRRQIIDRNLEILQNRDYKILYYVIHDMERMYDIMIHGGEDGINSILEGGIMKPF